MNVEHPTESDDGSSAVSRFCGHDRDGVSYSYCHDCKSVACSDCSGGTSCSDHDRIGLELLHNRQTETLRWSEMAANGRLEKLKREEADLAELENQLDRRYVEASKSVQDMYQYMLQVLSERRDEVMAGLDRSRSSKSAQIRRTRDQLSEHASRLESARDAARVLRGQPHRPELVDRKFAMAERVDSLLSFRPDLETVKYSVGGLDFYAHRETAREVVRRAFGFLGSVAAAGPCVDDDDDDDGDDEDRQ